MWAPLRALGHWALAVLAGVAACNGDSPRRGPPLDVAEPSSRLPSPPHQADPWAHPGSALPAVTTSAIATLFDQGLADPRGLPYRAITLRVRSVWGSEQVVHTRGWILSPAFAVAWSGLVVPIEEAGEAADLRADVERMIARDEEARATDAHDNPGHQFYRFRLAQPEEASTSAETLLPIRAALLLRLGEGELARRVWETWHVGMRANTNDDATHLTDPYLMLALDYTWALFDRAVNTHAQGDDRLARESVEQLYPLHAEVNRVARDRGFTVEGDDYLPFLDSLDALRADQQRRLRKEAPPPDRLGAMVAALEDVAARQWAQPGGVDLTEDPRVQALVREGDGAVEPLLSALESDARLTRSVSFHRDFSWHRHLVGVAEAAFEALSKILGSNTIVEGRPDLATPEGRRVAAAAVRAFVAEHRGQTPADRWYAVLADDRASTQQWIEAARSIVGELHPASHRGWEVSADRPPLPGEALRARTPSVTALLLRRLDALARDGKPIGGGTPYRVNVLHAGQIAMALGAWDPVGAAGALRAEVDRAERFMAAADPLQDSFDAEYDALLVARHTLALVRGGDDGALGRFTTWLQGVPLKKLGTNVHLVFEPLWMHADRPEAQLLLRWAFHDPGSPYLPLIAGSQRWVHQLFQTPIVDAANFRERVLSDLADRTARGTIRALSNNGYTVEYLGFQLSSGAEGPLPFTGTAPIRTCDVTAYMLTNMYAPQDAPRFRLYGPEPERDQAIAALAAFLRARPTR